MPLRVYWRWIGVGILLCLALGVTIFSAAQIARAVGGLQRTRHLAQSGDVRTIRPWMTLHYIARIYHVPESYLLQSLDIRDARAVRHTTLYALAPRLHLSTAALIQKIQQAILTYRQQHPATSSPGRHYSGIPPPTQGEMPA